MKKIIVGATGAIGSAVAKKLVNSGAEVHLVGRNQSSLEALASELNATHTVADVLEDGFAQKILSDLNNTAVDGLAYCVRATYDQLKTNNGSIVLFSTVAARKGFTNHSIISSAKAAVEGLTVSLAAEFAPNVRVNCIAPSLTKSKISEFITKNEKMAEAIAKSHPLKRIGEGVDFASIVEFLLSKNSSWMTGQIIGVDGGRSSVV
jgi:NAD(P)-dependent dehydrogenase (short-subunit alcohol dehydrogenase family)